MKTPLATLAIIILSLCSLRAEKVLELKLENDTAVDAVTGHPLTLQNVIVMGTGDKAYAEFNGKSAIIAAPDPTLNFQRSSTFWAEMWVEPLKVPKSVSVLSKGTGANYRILLQKDGSLALSYYSNGQWRNLASEKEKIPLETWSHVAGYFDSASGQAALFVNGTVVGLSKEMPPFQSNDDLPLYIGGQPGKEGSDELIGFIGAIGKVIVAKESPHELPSDLAIGTKAFSVEPVY